MNIRFEKGLISELVAMVFLKKKYPQLQWVSTQHFTDADLSGVDIMGKNGNTKMYVQVKSSERYVSAFTNPNIRVLIVPQDDDTQPYFLNWK